MFPAPQPPYDFVPFMLLAGLPVDSARGIYAVAIVAAVALCTVAIADLGVPIVVVAAALLLSVLFASLNTAQIVPFALLALAGCGWLLRRGSCALAGIAAALTAIEPSLGVAVIAATLIFVPTSALSASPHGGGPRARSREPCGRRAGSSSTSPACCPRTRPPRSDSRSNTA